MSFPLPPKPRRRLADFEVEPKASEGSGMFWVLGLRGIC